MLCVLQTVNQPGSHSWAARRAPTPRGRCHGMTGPLARMPSWSRAHRAQLCSAVASAQSPLPRPGSCPSFRPQKGFFWRSGPKGGPPALSVQVLLCRPAPPHPHLCLQLDRITAEPLPVVSTWTPDTFLTSCRRSAPGGQVKD